MKKLQSGRSMIEMLGVLAIIGVLSVGGLAAYNAAMDRNEANELLYDASLCLAEATTLATGAGADCHVYLEDVAAGRITLTTVGSDATVTMAGDGLAIACNKLDATQKAKFLGCDGGEQEGGEEEGGEQEE